MNAPSSEPLDELGAVRAGRDVPREALAAGPQRHEALQQLFPIEEKRPHRQSIEKLVGDEESPETGILRNFFE